MRLTWTALGHTILDVGVLEPLEDDTEAETEPTKAPEAGVAGRGHPDEQLASAWAETERAEKHPIGFTVAVPYPPEVDWPQEERRKATKAPKKAAKRRERNSPRG